MDDQFFYLCAYGQFGKATKLYKNNIININADNDNAFRWSCRNGHIKIAVWLYSKGVNINADNDYAFRWSCDSGQFQIVKWLYSKGVNINSFDNDAFISSCENSRFEIIKWLLLIGKFNNNIVDRCLPEKLYEYAFSLGYLPVNKMKIAYAEYKNKIKEELIEKNNNGQISIFGIDDLINIIVVYI